MTNMDFFGEGNFGELYWKHAQENYTYDHSRLRYAGPIPVFMYGDYSSWSFIADVIKGAGGQTEVDFKWSTGEAVTEEEFVRVNRRNGGQKYTYNSFMFDSGWNFKGKGVEKNKVAGTIYTVSLKGLRALDAFFKNYSTFDRDMLFIDSDSTKGNHDWAYSYFIRPSFMCDGVQENKLTFKQNFDIVYATKIVKVNGITYSR